MKIRQLAAASAIVFVAIMRPAPANPADSVVPESAREPIAVVDAFQAALRAGDAARAAGYLDPGVVILESGGAEWSAGEYLAGHAKADAEFLKAAKITQGPRSASVEGNLAWVASLAQFEAERDGEPLVIDGAETMVLRAGPDGWKILHIHWSSRTRK